MKENDWKRTILAMWILACVTVLAMAIIKNCKADEPKEEVAPVSTPVTVSAPHREVEKEYEWEAKFREEVSAQVDVVPERTRIGRCRLTVYTPNEGGWGYATATGVRSQHMMTCAVDPTVIPYGSNVIVIGKDGYEWRVRAVDCGNFRGNWVDIFYEDSVKHGIEWLDEAFGGDFAEVYIEGSK